MIHFSCDLCGKLLYPEDDQRYVVKIEACAAHDPVQITDADLEDDHLVKVSQLLRDMEDQADENGADPTPRTFRFDLCPECLKRFVSDPLGKEQGHKLFFSKN
jgi:hypothetical protein